MENIAEYWSYYGQGWTAWNKYFASNWTEKGSNPYKEDSDEWKAWNRGWNMNDKGTFTGNDNGCISCGFHERNCIC